MDFKEAERAALAWMRSLGYVDAKLTKGGADGGIDVESATAVAQVKAEQNPTGRPAVQKIRGAATNLGREALFFATAGYTRQASVWADEAGVALFELRPDGNARPVNVHAQRITDNWEVGRALDGDTVNLTRGMQLNEDTSVDLPFTLTECDACGETSPKAAGCQSCGATPPAEDPAASARRFSIEAARARVRSSPARPTPVTAGDIFLEFAETDVLSKHIALISVVGNAGSDWQSRYADNLRQFDALRQRSISSTNRSDRIWGPVWPQLDRILGITAEVIDAYERGATASTPDLAATYFRDGQQGIDRLTQAIADYRMDLDERTRRNVERATSQPVAGSGCTSIFFSLLLLLTLVFSWLIAWH
jgi:hypothetical protein